MVASLPGRTAARGGTVLAILRGRVWREDILDCAQCPGLYREVRKLNFQRLEIDSQDFVNVCVSLVPRVQRGFEWDRHRVGAAAQSRVLFDGPCTR